MADSAVYSAEKLLNEQGDKVPEAAKSNVQAKIESVKKALEGDDINEPVSDAVRGVLDGHIVLARKLAIQNHYPAIDVLRSISRVMDDVVQPKQLESARSFKSFLATYKKAEDLINIGAYADGSMLAILVINLINPLLDKIRPKALGKV